MSYRILHPDCLEIQNSFGVKGLASAAIASSGLSGEQIEELLSSGEALAMCRSESMKQVLQRLQKAKEAHEQVFVAGDYDADGICSTAIMKDILDRLSIPNGYYIPDRFREGYGLSEKIVSMVHEKGYSLIITVDNGVKCFDSISLAKQLGMDVIVTDHHRIEEPVPSDILLHPDTMEPCFEHLSGAGVVLQLSRCLFGDIPMHTALAAIALIGDVMPLWKETRKIVQKGLQEIARGALPSVMPLLRQGAAIDQKTVSFQIVPKLNSVGRMNDRSNVNTLVPFLLCRDPMKIQSYAKQLEEVNSARRRLSDSMVRKAMNLDSGTAFPVLFDESFFEGVNGLAAGKLSRTWNKPVLVFSRHENLFKGSGRGISGFDLYSFFSGFEELEEFGGHPGAVGIAVREERFEEFCMHVQRHMEEIPFAAEEPCLQAFAVHPDHLSIEEIMEFESLRPFPSELVTLAAVKDPLMMSCRAFDRVIRYHFANLTEGFDGVKFTSSKSEPKRDIRWLIGTPGINRFRDRITAQIEIEELIGPGEESELCGK